MVSASKPSARHLAALSSLAVWISGKLSVAAALGLACIPLLLWNASFLAPHSTAAPVELARTPVPGLDAVLPERPAVAPRPPVKERVATILKVVSRRAKREAERESGALGKAGVESGEATPPVAKPGAPKAAAPDAKSADPKSAAASPLPPAPDQWSDAEIIAALRDCLRRLAPLGADIELEKPIKQERCGAPAPVVLRRLGSGAGKVELQPPATLNCAMVASLHVWAEKALQPAAQKLLGSPIVRIRNVSGYVCRNRIGTPKLADRLSEHALANALDIAAFVTADGRTVDVLSQWGPTVRDLREAQERAWEAAQAAKAAAEEAASEAAEAARAAAKTPRGPKRDQAAAEAARKKDEAARKREEAGRKREEAQRKEAEWRKSLTRAADVQKPGRGAAKKGANAKGLTPIIEDDDDDESTEAAFLRHLHKGACGIFGTVLGPEANEAHRNHFHFDLATRKHRAFCQ